MFEKITPEQAGISSRAVHKMIDYLERRGIVMHSVLLMKGESIFAEGYYAPFTQDFCHRMYSETKSYVGVAIGLLEQDGKLSLDDKIADHFRDKIDGELHPWLEAQTIRQMLTMTTSVRNPSWFSSSDPDRTHLYLNGARVVRPAGTLWEYDSPGSQVLASLVERLSGKTLFEFLDERIFSHLGTFKGATILKTKNGDSWGDSALVCTTRDMASFVRFVMNYGEWHGERILNENYLRTATSPVVDNSWHGHNFKEYASYGYGYQIWCTEQGGFSFNGMGGQFVIALPKHDLIFVCTGDNQGRVGVGEMVFDAFFDYVANEMQSAPLPEDAEAYEALESYLASLKIPVVEGAATSPCADEIADVEFVCEENPMGISRFCIHLEGDGGEFRYTNAQGDKVLPFGIGRQAFSKFPQDGYSDEYGGLPGPEGFRYDAATSAAWGEARRFNLFSRIIDRYFGNLMMTFSWTENGEALLTMEKCAENFLGEYQGSAIARVKKS